MRRGEDGRGVEEPEGDERGARVPVDILIQHLSAGDSLDDFPSVSREQAVAYLEMAAETTDAATA